MFKRNIFKILAIVFFLLAGASFYNSNKITSKRLVKNKSVAKKHISSKVSVSPTHYVLRTTPYLSPTITNYSIEPTNTPAPQPTNTPPPAETSTKEEQGLAVSLNINGSLVGSFGIPQDSNQCDVLTHALSQGKIQSLNMRFNNDLGTNAVYQINGIGKENTVWWTFKVNGQSPSQGCSYIKANNGDNIVWEYIGN